MSDRGEQREGEIWYGDKSPELYEGRPPEQRPGGGEPEGDGQTMQPDEELLRTSAYYRKLFPEQAAALDEKEGRSQEKPFYDGDPSAPLIIVNKLSGHEILRVPGYNHPNGYKECLQQFKGQLSLGIIEGDLSGDNVFLDRANFRDAQVSSSFRGAHLSEAVFDGAELECNFNNTDLRGASFKKCDLTQCTFKGANLTMADLRGAQLPEAEALQGANMSNVKM